MSIVVSAPSSTRLSFIAGIRQFRVGGIGLGKIPWFIPHRWLRPGLVPPAPFLQCEPCLTSGGSGVLSDPVRIDEEFRKAWLPYFCRSGQRETSLDEFSFEVDGWLPLLPEVQLPRLTGQMIADVVHRKSISAGGLDGWGWRELKVLPVSWFDALARILTKVEDLGVWPDGLLDASITIIPKSDGDATPLGQRPLTVLPVVYRIWACWMIGFGLGFLMLFIVLVEVVVRLRPGKLLLLTLRRFFLVLLIPMFTFLLLMLLILLILLTVVFLIVSCLVLVFLAGFVMLILSTMLMFDFVLG